MNAAREFSVPRPGLLVNRYSIGLGVCKVGKRVDNVKNDFGQMLANLL